MFFIYCTLQKDEAELDSSSERDRNGNRIPGGLTLDPEGRNETF